MSVKKPEDLALEKAKIQLMMMPNTIFFTTILFSLLQEWKNDCGDNGTADVDGKTLRISPKWFLDMSEKERVGLLTHEILHVALSHMTRCGTKDPKIWNYAGDYVINLELKDSGYEIPKTDLIDTKYRNMSTEEVYKIIFEESQKNPNGTFGANGIGIPGSGDVKFPQDSKQLDTTVKGIADIVLRAQIQSQSANEKPGNTAGEIDKQLQSTINPKLPWNVILQNHMQNFLKDNFSWRRPNKRFMPKFYLPTAYSEAICNIAIAVDSSGSVSDEEFGFFITEIATIQETMKPEKITLIDFDTRVRSTQEILEGTNCFKDLKFTGGGGTCVKETLTWTQKHKPDILLVFTDGEFSMPNKTFYPNSPVIWIIHNDPNFNAPFGEIVNYDMGND